MGGHCGHRRDNDVKELLQEIACCEIVRHHLDGPALDHPCSTIITAQGSPSRESFQVPEPWSGHLPTASILFLSSNPSISGTEEYPRSAAAVSYLESFFNARFDGHWIRDNRARNTDGTYGEKVRYWSSIQNRATELLDKPAVPGVDYALSEIVHCKSKSEAGVISALNVCAGRYLVKLLSCSVAPVVVLVGRKALYCWNSLQVDALPEVPEREGTDVHEIAGRKRIIVYLGHPSGPEPKRFRKWVSEARMHEIRSFIFDNTNWDRADRIHPS